MNEDGGEPRPTLLTTSDAPDEVVLHEAVFQRDQVVAKFINCMMHDGKKMVSSRIFDDAMKVRPEPRVRCSGGPLDCIRIRFCVCAAQNIKVKQLAEARAASEKAASGTSTPSGIIYQLPYADPLETFHRAVENVKPTIALTPVKKSGSVYQVRA
jgi:ribosomal protein S7